MGRKCWSAALAFSSPCVGVRRLSLLAERGVYPSRDLLGYQTGSRTGTGDGCCFFLSHDASDSKHKKKQKHKARQVVWKVPKAVPGLGTSPRHWQEHLTRKLREPGFLQDERGPMFVHGCGPRYLHLCACGRYAAKDMEMRQGIVTEKRQALPGRSLSRTTSGFIFGVAEEYVKQLCTDFGSGELKGANNLVFENPRRMTRLWMRTDKAGTGSGLAGCIVQTIKNAVCQLSTHVGTATIRDEAVKRLLRYLVGNPLCNKMEGCTLDVPTAAGRCW